MSALPSGRSVTGSGSRSGMAKVVIMREIRPKTGAGGRGRPKVFRRSFEKLLMRVSIVRGARLEVA